ncbi:AtpZ/AtpI family protein [Paenibacillus sp. IB182496]|uniref:AtpZ/AtpI family protein n=1 Tax=Paenibacillus sabuli TaxID=2772509 RepID=A0A927GS38_9BACL|nr:AtpZ/AtpI family protein [Paenibacillus sabuli]MBD2845896.1 AtpZ/AtpI family protein [Paenibacillus sabuli]
MKSKRNGEQPWRAAGLVGVMGLDIAVCMCLGYYLGDWLGDSRGWVVFGLLFGLFVGIFSCIMLIKKIVEDTDG